MIYRKISVKPGWYDIAAKRPLIDAFKPHTDDASGISVDRAQSASHPDFKTPQQAGQGRSKKGYYVAVLRVGDLRQNGIRVVANPLPDDLGHTELPDLRYDNRKSDRAVEIKDRLVRLTIEVVGPFLPEEPKSE